MKCFMSFILIQFCISIAAFAQQSGWEQHDNYMLEKLKIPNLQSCKVSADGTQFYTYHGDQKVYKWDMNTGILLDSIMLDSIPERFVFSSDGEAMVYYTSSGFFAITDLKTGSILAKKNINFQRIFPEIEKSNDNILHYNITRIDYVHDLRKLLILFSYMTSSTYDNYECDEDTGLIGIMDIVNGDIVFYDKLPGIPFGLAVYKGVLFYTFGNNEYCVYEKRDDRLKISGFSSYDFETKLNTKLIYNIYKESYDWNTDQEIIEGKDIVYSQVLPINDSIILVKVDSFIHPYNLYQNKFDSSIGIPTFITQDYPKYYSEQYLTSDKRLLIQLFLNRLYLYSPVNFILLDSFDIPIQNAKLCVAPGKEKLIAYNKKNEIVLLDTINRNKKIDCHVSKTFARSGDTILFFYKSFVKATKFKWYFGDGDSSLLKDPVHPYKREGVYTPVLKVWDQDGIEYSITKESLIVISDTLIPDFMVSQSIGTAPLTVTFTNISKGTLNYIKWDFGDGDTSNLPNPVHTYATKGHYHVSLAIANRYETNLVTKRHAVVVDDIKNDSLYIIYNIPVKYYAYGDLKEFEVKDLAVVSNQYNKAMLLARVSVKYGSQNGHGDVTELFESAFVYSDSRGYFYGDNYASTNYVYPSINVPFHDSMLVFRGLDHIYKFDNYLSISPIFGYPKNLEIISACCRYGNYYIGCNNMILTLDNELNKKDFFYIEGLPIKISVRPDNSLSVIVSRDSGYYFLHIVNKTVRTDRKIKINKSVIELKRFEDKTNGSFIGVGSSINGNISKGFMVEINLNGDIVKEILSDDLNSYNTIESIGGGMYYLTTSDKRSVIIIDSTLERKYYYDIIHGHDAFIIKDITKLNKNEYIIGGIDTRKDKKLIDGLDRYTCRLARVDNYPDVLPTAVEEEEIYIDESQPENVWFYPNPANSRLYVNTISSDREIKIYNLFGQEVLSAGKQDNLSSINTESLPTGAYMIKSGNRSGVFIKE